MTNKCWKLVNGNHQKTAQETVKYEVHGGAPDSPPNHQRYAKPKASRGLTVFILIRRF